MSNKEKLYTFYIVECVVTGKSYIGCTSFSLKKRWADHRSMAKTNPKSCFHKAMHEFGESNFIPKVLDERFCNRKDAVLYEESLITKFGTRENGYNMSWARHKEVNGWFNKGASNDNFTNRDKNPSVGRIQDTCKPVHADGLDFISMSHTAKHFGITYGAVKFRCLSPSKRFKKWFFLDDKSTGRS